jgi:glycerophosphoryl diester phosphodiesterase
MIPVVIILIGSILYLGYKTKKTPIPHTYWKRFNERGTVPLDAQSCHDLQGVYAIEEGRDKFGETAVMKWSYTIEDNKTIYHLSLFCAADGSFMVCEGRYNGNDILLNGFWRQLSASETGTIRLIAAPTNNTGRSDHQKQSLTIRGWYGEKENLPDKAIILKYQRPIPNKKPLDIIAHRGGARNIDFLSTSENSLQMMKTAARLGATGVEIDVRLTKDGVPVIIHDSFLSLHTIKNAFYAGLVSNYTLQELKEKELKKGGHVPTLQETLHTILYNTPLELVWLDIKKKCDLRLIRNLQLEYLKKAKQAGRNLRILIGIPDKTILNCFLELEDYKQLPSLTELDTEIAETINANVWAPQYTGGFQKEEVQRMQAQGRKAFVWSLDNITMIELYLKEGGFDGVVTNAPPVVFHTYYTSEEINAAVSQ